MSLEQSTPQTITPPSELPNPDIAFERLFRSSEDNLRSAPLFEERLKSRNNSSAFLLDHELSLTLAKKARIPSDPLIGHLLFSTRIMLRAIFDRSAFHGDAFEQLQASSLGRLCRQGELCVFHTPIFLEETLAMYGNEKNSSASHPLWRSTRTTCHFTESTSENLLGENKKTLCKTMR